MGSLSFVGFMARENKQFSYLNKLYLVEMTQLKRKDDPSTFEIEEENRFKQFIFLRRIIKQQE